MEMTIPFSAGPMPDSESGAFPADLQAAHCGLPRAELSALAEKLLEVPPALIVRAVGEELVEGSITADRVGEADCIFLTGLYQAERASAGHLERLRRGPLPWPEIDADRALQWIEARSGLSLALRTPNKTF